MAHMIEIAKLIRDHSGIEEVKGISCFVNKTKLRPTYIKFTVREAILNFMKEKLNYGDKYV